MYLKQGDLFWGMSKEFVQEAMETTTRQTSEEGDWLFREGAPAYSFFILIKGRVQLSIGDVGQTVYVARHPGEIIGWSSIIGGKSFSASAQCLEQTHLLKVDREQFLGILEKDPANEVILFKRLSEMLGNRLLEVYPNLV
ncbi:MAG: cyclic nucleotide-binding domain-containing protein [Desulfobacteraceae bacterium]|nr:cyclic nucleotide-binding domain-containing protein [Desulfobacteraceae bacterium]